jgi:hypothetical protein
MYLSDDMTEQELADTAAQRRAEAQAERESQRAPRQLGPWAAPDQPEGWKATGKWANYLPVSVEEWLNRGRTS